ncbi:MAG: hypothetical protein K2P58_15865 [Hyphomonadaceae bacterium]|nr:hypothetical protein [Hyphomonadaceae bacterium]
MDACITACLACHRAWVEGIVACLNKGGRHATTAHIQALLNCAQIFA